LPSEIPFLPGLDATVTVHQGKLLTQWALPDVDPGQIAEDAYKRMREAGPNATKRMAAFQSLQPAPETASRLDEALVRLCTQLEGDGWSVEQDETSEVPFPRRRIVLAKGGRERELARGAIFGLPAVTMRELS
jgi:hypothetical protein